MTTKTGNTYMYISGTMTDRMTVPTANLGFSTTPSSQKHPGRMTDSRKWQYGRFACQSCNFWQSIVVAIIWLIFCRARHNRKSRIWRWNLDAICQSSRDVIVSGFGAISIFPVRCCTYLPTLFYTTALHLHMVLYPRFVVGIYKYFRFRPTKSDVPLLES